MAKRKITKVPPPKDELVVASLDKYKSHEVGDRTITIRQWPYKPGLVLSAQLVDAAKSLAVGKGANAVDISVFMKLNITDFISNFTELGTAALHWGIDAERSGFSDPAKCIAWQDELSMTEMVRLFTEIVKMNITPLVSALGDLKKVASLQKSRQAPAPTSPQRS